MDLVTQDSYKKRHKQSTVPPALAKEKEVKDEPIQKNCETNKTTGKTPKQQQRITTAGCADIRTGHHFTSVPQSWWKATTATK